MAAVDELVAMLVANGATTANETPIAALGLVAAVIRDPEKARATVTRMATLPRSEAGAVLISASQKCDRDVEARRRWLAAWSSATASDPRHDLESRLFMVAAEILDGNPGAGESLPDEQRQFASLIAHGRAARLSAAPQPGPEVV
jgi:hypothetical protein